MRVLNVIHTYAPVVGGSEKLIQMVAEGLAATGDDVWVFTSNARGTQDFIRPTGDSLPEGVERLNGVSVRRFPFLRLPRTARRTFDRAAYEWWTRRWPGYGLVKSAWVGPHLLGVVRAAVRLEPDLIVTTASPFMPLFRAARAGRRARVPVLLMPCLHPGDRWLLDNPALFRLFRRVDGLLPLTDYEALFLRSMGVEASRIHVLGGGVSLPDPGAIPRDLRPRFGIPPAAPIVLFLGRKEEAKGIRDVVDAMSPLWSAGSDAVLVLAGAATEYSRTVLDPYLASLAPGLRARIVSRDDITDEERWGWFEECAVFAHPSKVESFGIVYLEAWACGKPVVGCRSGPVSSLVAHGRSGLLVAWASPEELSGAIGRLLADAPYARALGEEGRRTALSRYTWPAIVARAREIYADAVRRGARSAP